MKPAPGAARMPGATLGRFVLVGVVATLTHILVVTALLSTTTLPPLLSNTFAFLAAVGVSFMGHLTWTFQFRGNSGQALQRFLITAFAALACNTLVLEQMLRSGWLPAPSAAIIAAAVIPSVTYLANKLWVFKDDQET